MKVLSLVLYGEQRIRKKPEKREGIRNSSFVIVTIEAS